MSFRGDKNIHYFDYGDVFINVYVCQYIGQTVQTVYPKHKIYCLPIILQKKKKIGICYFSPITTILVRKILWLSTIA